MSGCPGVEAGPDGLCIHCRRPVATYGGREQHRRGGSGLLKAQQIEAAKLVPERLTAIEEQLAAVVTTLASLSAQIDRWVARQPLILEVRLTHRRQSDGGEGGRDELRETRRRLRKVAGE